jgi:hypothetical protein
VAVAPRVAISGLCFGVSLIVLASDFAQRFLAAVWAMLLRSAGVSESARARPPFKPPLRPSSIAAGFLPLSFGSGAAISSI